MYSDESNFNKSINTVMGFCSRQYFSYPRCKEQQGCTKSHVHRVYYPCIHYYLGNCKYGFNCKFAHSMQSKLPADSPDLVCFFSLMGGCINPT